jgi:gamma-glutamylcysteine synthetase
VSEEKREYGYGIGVDLGDKVISLDVTPTRHRADEKVRLLEHLHRYANVEIDGESIWICRCSKRKPCS